MAPAHIASVTNGSQSEGPAMVLLGLVVTSMA